jgi:hypothetical protein
MTPPRVPEKTAADTKEPSPPRPRHTVIFGGPSGGAIFIIPASDVREFTWRGVAGFAIEQGLESHGPMFLLGSSLTEGATARLFDASSGWHIAHETSSAATTPDTADLKVASLLPQIRAILTNAEYEDLETGVASEFSRELSAFVARHGVSAIQALEEALESRLPSSVVMSVLSRLLGRMPDPQTHSLRRRLLVALLRSNAVQVRYAAAAGLAALDDPQAIPALEQAITREKHDRPQAHLQLVLNQLRDTERAAVPHR